MKFILGVLLIVGGIIGGLYFGLWWAFIGGIIQIIEQLKAPSLDALTVALGIVKIIFSALIGWATFFVCLFLGGTLCESRSRRTYSISRSFLRKPPVRNRNK